MKSLRYHSPFTEKHNGRALLVKFWSKADVTYAKGEPESTQSKSLHPGTASARKPGPQWQISDLSEMSWFLCVGFMSKIKSKQVMIDLSSC